ncbi:MAG: hypothetical protein HUJ76_07310 [Parasporobacterium sp.]|nr:hypothetical protein [Parasporobacterium sp.]
MYVAMTRAENHLHISYVRKDHLKNVFPSPFIQEIRGL